MAIHIRANTIYGWHGVDTDSVVRIINSIEWALDSQSSCSCDLFLPNCFIDGCENSNFWYRMAAVVSVTGGVTDWHELEYGAHPNRGGQRYVYTWTLCGALYRFYTKKPRDVLNAELFWYVGKGGDCDSDCDTDTEDIMLRHT